MEKKVNEMTLDEQESWLVKKLQEYYAIEDDIKRMLATVRGGQRIKINE
jgi:hypothetical protein